MLTQTKFWLTTIPAVTFLVLLGMNPEVVPAQAVVVYNPTNGQLSIDTTGGIGGAGFNLIAVKLPGPEATSIDRWADGTSQDGVSDWSQVFTTNNNNGVTAEQWLGLSGGGNNAPDAAVPPGTYQIATYPTGLTAASFTGDPASDIGVGQIELGGWSSSAAPGSVEYSTISISTGGGFQCDYVGAAGCDINDLNALYAGTNGAPSPLTDAAIATWLTQASDGTNPLKASSTHTYVLGDANLNGQVDSTDLGLHLNNFGNTAGLDWGQGNFNSDANIDSTDLGVLLNNFSFTSASANAVPEPAGATWIIFALLGPLLGLRSVRSKRTS